MAVEASGPTAHKTAPKQVRLTFATFVPSVHVFKWEVDIIKYIQIDPNTTFQKCNYVSGLVMKD